MHRHNQESGAIAIDALIGLVMFLGTVFSLMFFAMIIKVQSTVQYALCQTAKEISGYYYLLDKTGITKITSGAVGSDVTEQVGQVNDTIGYVMDFADMGKNDLSTVTNLDLNDMDSITALGSTFDAGHIQDYKDAATQITSAIGDLNKDNLKAVLTVFAKSMANKGISYFVTPFVCKAVMPKYIAPNLEECNAKLEALGVVGGIDNMDFSRSQLLTDGRSIKISVVYEFSTKKLTFGLIDKRLFFRCAASTASWIAPDNKNTLTLTQIADAQTAMNGGGEGGGT